MGQSYMGFSQMGQVISKVDINCVTHLAHFFPVYCYVAVCQWDTTYSTASILGETFLKQPFVLL